MKIGYFAHSHGYGHCNYARIMAEENLHRTTIFSSSDYTFEKEVEVVRLPDDDDEIDSEFQKNFPEPSYLHYAPIGSRSILARNRVLLQQIESREIELLIIDVSVEIASLARVSSVPYAYVRMFGQRNDSPHLEAYRGAVFLVAYFSREMEMAATPRWIIAKTLYLGITFSTDLRKKVENFYLNDKANSLWKFPKRQKILFLTGRDIPESDDFLRLCRISVNHNWNALYVGSFHANELPEDQYIGFVDDTASYILEADLVVATSGMNTVSELAAMEKAMVLVPDPRPFDEQNVFADILYRLELAYKPSEVFNLGLENLKYNPQWRECLGHSSGHQLHQMLTDAGNLLNFKNFLSNLTPRIL